MEEKRGREKEREIAIKNSPTTVLYRFLLKLCSNNSKPQTKWGEKKKEKKEREREGERNSKAENKRNES